MRLHTCLVHRHLAFKMKVRPGKQDFLLRINDFLDLRARGRSLFIILTSNIISSLSAHCDHGYVDVWDLLWNSKGARDSIPKDALGNRIQL